MRVGDVRLEPQRGSLVVARARDQVRSFCQDMPEEVGARAERLAAQLVSTAAQADGAVVRLRLSATEGSLLVEVADDSTRSPSGLAVVEAYFVTWTTDADEHGAGRPPPFPIGLQRVSPESGPPPTDARSSPLPAPVRRPGVDARAAAAWLLVAVVTVGWVCALAYLGALAYRAAVSP